MNHFDDYEDNNRLFGEEFDEEFEPVVEEEDFHRCMATNHSARRRANQLHKERDRARNSNYSSVANVNRVSSRASKGTTAYSNNKRDKRMMENDAGYANANYATRKREAMRELVSPAEAQAVLDQRYRERVDALLATAREKHAYAAMVAVLKAVEENMELIVSSANNRLLEVELADVSIDTAMSAFHEMTEDFFAKYRLSDLAKEIYDAMGLIDCIIEESEDM